uniref:NADH-ubiquinone oxidoreductase chain 4L n=1 Tax=Anadara antiquata TaxID=142560 RepID=A0A516IDG0_9BIVA|nr:NADH dehydrogenase subunit 4L [Anadara antiquata]
MLGYGLSGESDHWSGFNKMVSFLVVLFLGGFVSLWENKHILSVMVGVELMFLSVICVSGWTIGIHDMTSTLILLVLSVCEAALMVGVLVRIVRGFGNDLVLSLGVLSC